MKVGIHDTEMLSCWIFTFGLKNVGKEVTGKKSRKKVTDLGRKKVTGKKVTNIKSSFFYLHYPIMLENGIISIITNIVKIIFVLGLCFTSRLSFFSHAMMELMLPEY